MFLQLLIALITRAAVIVCAISKGFLLVSLVTNRLSLDELCLPSFDALNCWLNLVSSFLGDENELPLKVLDSFVSTDQVLDLFIQYCQFRRGDVSFTGVISSGHHVQYLAGTSSLWSLCRLVWMWCDADFSRIVRKGTLVQGIRYFFSVSDPDSLI